METVRQAEDWMRRASALMAQAERLNLNHPDNVVKSLIDLKKES